MNDGSGKIYIDENYWDYSSTTGKYRNDFLGENKNLTQMKINSGEYILTDLNKQRGTNDIHNRRGSNNR